MSQQQEKKENKEAKKWITKSLALNAAARKIREKMQECVDTYSMMLEPKNFFPGQFTADVICTSLMMLNYSAETIVKAKIVKEQQGKKLVKKLKNRHNSVVAYAKQANIPLTEEEEEVLGELHKIAETSRMPESEKSEEQVIKTVAKHYMHMETYFDTVNRFIFKVCKKMSIDLDQSLVA